MTITNSAVVNNSEDGLDLTGENIVLDGVWTENNSAVGIKLFRRSGDNYAPKDYTITNSVIIDNGEAGIKADHGPDFSLVNAVIYNNQEIVWLLSY